MGTDIHLYVEKRSRESKNKNWNVPELRGRFTSRIYGMFAALNNVCNFWDIEHLENRGLPEDISWMAFHEYYLRIKDKPEVDSRECSEENAKKWEERGSSVIKTEGNCRYCSDPDYHHPSWCTIKELEECYDRVFKVYKCERSDSIEWLALINYMKTLEEVYDVRAVFWFDD